MKHYANWGLLLCAVIVSSCGTSKKTTGIVAPAVESSRSTITNLEGEKVAVQTVQLTGIEYADALNDDGTEIIKRPYRWFAATHTADNKQIAIEMAQREAYATISRVLNNAVKDNAYKSAITNNVNVVEALNSNWTQVSQSLTKACEPFGNTTIEYNSSTRMYTVTAKVAVRGDRFNQLLNTAGSFKPTNLTGDDLNLFIETNKAIMEAARGN